MCKTSILGGDGCADASKCVPWFQRTHGLGEARTRRDPSNDAMMAADGTLSCCTLWRRFGHCSAESLLTGHCRELARPDGSQPRAGAQSPRQHSLCVATRCGVSKWALHSPWWWSSEHANTDQPGRPGWITAALTVCWRRCRDRSSDAAFIIDIQDVAHSTLKVRCGIMCRSSNAIIAVLKSQTNRESNLLLKTMEMKEIILFKQHIFSLLWKNNVNLENDFHRMDWALDSNGVSMHVESATSNQKY